MGKYYKKASNLIIFFCIPANKEKKTRRTADIISIQCLITINKKKVRKRKKGLLFRFVFYTISFRCQLEIRKKRHTETQRDICSRYTQVIVIWVLLLFQMIFFCMRSFVLRGFQHK
jgi:hypothetical protein